MTKVVALCSSARMENSNTAKILKPFLEGMEEAGATVELIYTKHLDVRPCEAEFNCWTKNPGKCYIDDSMQLLYPRLRDADILVFATPVYIPLPGEMQNLLNRMLPLIERGLTWRDGRTRFKKGFRADVKVSKFVLVSTSGWWEMGNFGVVLKIFKELAKAFKVEFAGALLRPNAPLLSEHKEKADRIFKAAKQAGNQLVKDGRMSKDLLKIIGQPLMSQKEWRHGL